MSKWNVKTFGCSLPKALLKTLDTIRGDVNRSRYIQRLVEKNINAIVQANPEIEAPERLTLLDTKRIGDPKTS
jgi:metal-responsive CopG/Arc/MetJ family transcriptional regulator